MELEAARIGRRWRLNGSFEPDHAHPRKRPPPGKPVTVYLRRVSCASERKRAAKRPARR